MGPQRVVGTRSPSDQSISARRHDGEGRLAHRRVGADSKGAADSETAPAVTRRTGFPDGLRSSRRPRARVGATSGAVASAPGAASVRVWQVMSRGRDPSQGRPPPEGVHVAYPL